MTTIDPTLLAEYETAKAQAEKARNLAQIAAQHVEILMLRIAVRYGLPPGATWDSSGVVTLPEKPQDI